MNNMNNMHNYKMIIPDGIGGTIDCYLENCTFSKEANILQCNINDNLSDSLTHKVLLKWVESYDRTITSISMDDEIRQKRQCTLIEYDYLDNIVNTYCFYGATILHVVTSHNLNEWRLHFGMDYFTENKMLEK